MNAPPRATAARTAEVPSGRDRRLAVAAGGAVGTGLRLGAAAVVPVGPSGWPWATFVVNLAGAYALGWLLGRAGRNLRTRPLTVPFLGTGILGSFTTFSTFAVEVADLVGTGRATLGAGYGLASVGAGAVLAAIGRSGGGGRVGARCGGRVGAR